MMGFSKVCFTCLYIIVIIIMTDVSCSRRLNDSRRMSPYGDAFAVHKNSNRNPAADANGANKMRGMEYLTNWQHFRGNPKKPGEKHNRKSPSDPTHPHTTNADTRSTLKKEVSNRNVGHRHATRNKNTPAPVSKTENQFNIYPKFVTVDALNFSSNENTNDSMVRLSRNIQRSSQKGQTVKMRKKAMREILKTANILSNYTLGLPKKNVSKIEYTMHIMPLAEFTNISKTFPKRQDFPKQALSRSSDRSSKTRFPNEPDQNIRRKKETPNRLGIEDFHDQDFGNGQDTNNEYTNRRTQRKAARPRMAGANNITSYTATENGTTFISNIFNVPLTIYSFLTGRK